MSTKLASVQFQIDRSCCLFDGNCPYLSCFGRNSLREILKVGEIAIDICGGNIVLLLSFSQKEEGC